MRLDAKNAYTVLPDFCCAYKVSRRPWWLFKEQSVTAPAILNRSVGESLFNGHPCPRLILFLYLEYLISKLHFKLVEL